MDRASQVGGTQAWVGQTIAFRDLSCLAEPWIERQTANGDRLSYLARPDAMC